VKKKIKHCIITIDINITLYLLVFTTVGLFLWFRQRAFYANQFLNVDYKKVLKILSFVSIFVMVGSCLLLWILFIIVNVSFTSSPTGCVLQEKRLPVLSDIFDIYWILAAICIIFFYSVLIGLLSYALLSIMPVSTNNIPNTNRCIIDDDVENAVPMTTQHNYFQKSKFSKTKPMCLNNTCKTSKNKNSSQQKILVLKRTLLFAVLSLATFVAAHAVIQYNTIPNEHFYFSLLILNIDAFLQLLFVIFSFTAHEKTLTSSIDKCLA